MKELLILIAIILSILTISGIVSQIKKGHTDVATPSSIEQQLKASQEETRKYKELDSLHKHQFDSLMKVYAVLERKQLKADSITKELFKRRDNLRKGRKIRNIIDKFNPLRKNEKPTFMPDTTW